MVSMVSILSPVSMVSIGFIGYVRFLWFPWFLCGFHGFYTASPWFLWFPLALCGFYGFHGFYAVSMVSIMFLQMGTLRGYSVNTPVIFQGTIRQRHVGSRPHSSIEKSAFLCNARLKPWKQHARLRTQLAKRHIRNRDNSVHRLSAVRALNFHRKRSTCVLLTSVGCKRS